MEEEYIEVIKKMPYVHCARGSSRCVKCQEFAKKPETYALVKVFLTPSEYARPMTDIIINNERIYGAYDILKRFKDIIEAKNYAKEQNIDITFY